MEVIRDERAKLDIGSQGKVLEVRQSIATIEKCQSQKFECQKEIAWCYGRTNYDNHEALYQPLRSNGFDAISPLRPRNHYA